MKLFGDVPHFTAEPTEIAVESPLILLYPLSVPWDKSMGWVAADKFMDRH